MTEKTGRGAAESAPETTDTPTTQAPGAPAAETTAPGAVAFPYATIGAAFASWFNDRIRRLPNATLKLGTKTATVVELHADGRLECSLHASAGEPEQQFVAFDPSYLEQLLLKFAAQGS